MSIWSTLFVRREDEGMEATLIRPLFEGMGDLDVDPDVDACAGWILFTGAWRDSADWIDACTWSD